MRIPSGKTDQVIYFVAVDSTDLKTRETGLTSFTVYRSRNGAAATAYTTPTVAELSAANMPGVYSLLIDEDTTIAAGSDSEEYCVHITQAAMAPVTRTIELYRREVTTGNTLSVSAAGRALSDLDTIKTQSVTCSGGVTVPAATLASTTNITAATGIVLSGVTHTGAVIPTVSAVTGLTASNLDATVSSRMASYTQPTGFLAATFPSGTIANTTNITAGTITTATNVTTVNGLAAGVITAASIAADAITDAKVAADVTIASVTGSVGSVTGAVGSVTGNVGGNVVGSVGSVTAAVTVGAINANTITATSIAADAITAAKIATGAIDADALATDAITEIWAASTDPSAAAIADAVWDEATSGHQTAGTTGKALTDAGAGGDPWATSLPGAYSAGTAGKILGDNLNATVSSRATQSSVDTVDDFLDTEIAAIKAKTDQLSFTVANQVDSNIQYVNDVQVTGTGAPGSEWGP